MCFETHLIAYDKHLFSMYTHHRMRNWVTYSESQIRKIYVHDSSTCQLRNGMQFSYAVVSQYDLALITTASVQ